MKTSRVLILVCLGSLFSFGFGFFSGWQSADSTDRLMFGHALIARDEGDLETSCNTLQVFNDGKPRRTAMHVQGAVDFYASMLESDFRYNPNQHKKEADEYKRLMAIAKKMQKNWPHIEPGSFESTNGPGILTTNFDQ